MGFTGSCITTHKFVDEWDGGAIPRTKAGAATTVDNTFCNSSENAGDPSLFRSAHLICPSLSWSPKWSEAHD
jgi:hypothetical protein